MMFRPISGAIAACVAACALSLSAALPAIANATPAASSNKEIALPSTIPELTGWQKQNGSWTAAKEVTVVRPENMAASADLLVSELRAYLKVKTIRAATSASGSAIVLKVDPSRKEQLGQEGYELKITSSGPQITAADVKGAFWGSRTLSQMLRQQLTLPAGKVVDIPKYKERGITLCACQINISTDWIDRLLAEMADLKMNYLLLEMKLKSQKYPQANTWSYYTRDDVAKLVKKANTYGIDVIPEINSPGHMNIWLENKPELQLADFGGRKSANHLDLSNPAAVKFYLDLIDEYDGVFTTKYWHMGADEYMFKSDFPKYPKLTQWAKDKYGANATIGDAFIDYINKVNAHIKKQGKQLRIWNDGIIDTEVIKLDKDIVVEYWDGNGRKAEQVAQEGYKLMNAHMNLYYSRVPSASWGIQWFGPQKYYGSWDLGQFPGRNQNISADNPAITGAKLSLWPDNGIRQTENEVEEDIYLGLRYGSQMFWKGKVPVDNPTWDSFKKERIDKIGRTPVWNNSERKPLEDGVYSILTTDNKPLTGGNPVAIGGFDRWSLVHTPDNYYQLKSVEKGTCLGVYTGDKHLATVTQIGAAPELAKCADPSVKFTPQDQGDYSTRNPQKWLLIRTSPGADTFTLRNAVTLQDLAVASGKEAHSVDFGSDNARRPKAGAVVQLPADMTKFIWTFKRDKNPLIAQVTSDRKMVYPQSSAQLELGDDGLAKIRVMVENRSKEAVKNVTVTAPNLAGWDIKPASAKISEIGAQAKNELEFSARPLWYQGEKSLKFNITAGPDAIMGEVLLNAVCGPIVRPKAIAASSQELSGERAPNGRKEAATDGNVKTFWHSAWSKEEPPYPHWIDVELESKAPACGYVYTPRQGEGGQVKDYQIYVSNDGKSWGKPLVKGQFKHGEEPQTVSLKVASGTGTNTSYLATSAAETKQYFRLEGLNAQPGVAAPNVMSVAEIGIMVGTVPTAPKLAKPVAVLFDDVKTKYTIPAVEGVQYLVNGKVVDAGEVPVSAPVKVTVTAKAKEGYYIGDDSQSVWEHQFMLMVKPKPVLFDDVSMTVTVPEDPHITYLVGAVPLAPGVHKMASGTAISITATLKTTELMAFAKGAVTSWSHTFPQDSARPGKPTPSTPGEPADSGMPSGVPTSAVPSGDKVSSGKNANSLAITGVGGGLMFLAFGVAGIGVSILITLHRRKVK